MRVVRTDSGASVPVGKIEETLARSGLVATLAPGDALRFHGLELASPKGATLYLSLSSEFVLAAVLQGSAAAGGKRAGAGQVVMLPILGGEPAVERFHVRQFLAAPPPRGLRPAVRAVLEGLVPGQERRIFWGGLERTAFNAQSPVPPIVEGLRRDYLSEAPVVRLRRASGGDMQAFGRMMAADFVRALAARDTDTVRAYLHPTMFLATGGNLPASAWLARRHAFALSLTGGPLPAQLRGATLGVDAAGRLVVAGRSGGRWLIALSPLDNAVFVSALEPI
ncbi:MAG: hypothetical protein AB7U38_12845 [Hyphomicrobiales bacterium]